MSQRPPHQGDDAQKAYGLGPRLLATVAGATLFLALVPLILRGAERALDGWRSLGQFGPRSVTVVLGGIVAALGLSLVIWTALTQIMQGRGTPVPMMPPQQLLTGGPFALCRNPMWFGALSYYLGLAIARGSIWGLALVAALVGPVVSYHALREEPQLVARYGPAYLAYRARTPFMIPRRPRQ